MKWLRFIFSHSIFISFCAVALCFQSFALLNTASNNYYYWFVFFATLASYNFYWLVSKYSFSRSASFPFFFKKNMIYLLLFFGAGAGMLWSLFFLRSYYIFIAPGILLTLLYSLPLWPFKFVAFTKKAGFLKPVLLALTWAYITVVVPLAPLLKQVYINIILLFIARFLFMLLLCIIFDMRDAAIDKMHALHTLATDISRKNLQVVICIVFVLYITAGIFVGLYFHDTPQLLAFAATGVAVWVVYRLSLKPRGYLFYYFLVDGLMLLSPVATYIAAN